MGHHSGTQEESFENDLLRVELWLGNVGQGSKKRTMLWIECYQEKRRKSITEYLKKTYV